MSTNREENWMVYPCLMGDHQAWISYDHAVGDYIDKMTGRQMLGMMVELKNPHENGMPSADEVEELEKVDDVIDRYMRMHNGCYAGRITVDGARHYRCYVAWPEELIIDMLQQIQVETGYEPGYYLEDDMDRKAYWEDLFPDRISWEVCQNIRLIETIRESGDDLETPRHIDHFIYFDSEEKAQDFIAWAEQSEYELESAGPSEDESPRFLVRLGHQCSLELFEISGHTIALLEAADQFGGEYDGWETEVVNES